MDTVTGESDTSDNCFQGWIKISVPLSRTDAVVQTPSVDDATLVTEATFTLSTSVSNSGDWQSVPTTLRHYRYTDPSITTADTEAGTDEVAGLLNPPQGGSEFNFEMPSEHDGQSAFTFKLHFHEDPHSDFSYKTLRDHAFTVTGGSIENARRLNRPRNIRWEITVRPDGDGDVTIVLPATTDCAAQGAICTDDGRMLYNRIEGTVAGPSE